MATVLVSGFIGCAEFASATLVHPVIRRLDPDAQLVMEKGLLRTFGRVMPVGMTAAAVLAGILAGREPSTLLVVAAIVLIVALVVTIAGNVPINIRTGQIREQQAPEGFLEMRRRWDVFQLIRGSLQLLGFVLVVCGTVGAA